MAATPEEVLQYQKQIDDAKAETAKIKAEVDQLKAEKAKNELVSQYAKKLGEISVTKEIDIEEELAFCVATFPQVAQFQRYAERLEKNSKGKNEPPIGGEMIRTKGKVEGEREIATMADADSIIQYIHNHEQDADMVALGGGSRGAQLRYQKAVEAVSQGRK